MEAACPGNQAHSLLSTLLKSSPDTGPNLYAENAMTIAKRLHALLSPKGEPILERIGKLRQSDPPSTRPRRPFSQAPCLRSARI